MGLKKIAFKPIFFDSLGAKSSCTLVKTPEINILIDPGVAVMQPSFPAPLIKKIYWAERGRKEIISASREADVVVISHYHYDHYFPDDLSIYRGKLVLAKNPNEYINDSQRERAENFFSRLCKVFGGIELAEILQEHIQKTYGNPLEEIPHARDKDFGTYNRRRKELLAKGLKWFRNRAKHWSSAKVIPELKFKELEVKFAERKEFKFGKTKLRFTQPLFHGIEFSRVGWVFATVIERKKEKIIHSSDLNGPIIEDYADWLIRENPDVLILDGPMSYMFGYLLTRITLKRTIENAKRVLEARKLKLMIYDHHLPREPKFKERTTEVWAKAKKLKKKLLTAAEYLGKRPVVLTL